MNNQKTLLFYIFLIIQFLIPKKFHAQNTPAFHFYTITTENGLSSNLINDIKQDSLGYIWIATNDGLNRYDGNNFKIFKSGNLYDYISNNYIQSIEIVGNKLYAGTDGGLNIYDIQYDSISVLNTKQFDILGNSISALHKRTDSQILDLGIYRGGVQQLQLENNLLSTNRSLNQVLSSKEVSSILQRDNFLFVSTFDDGLNKINLNSNEIETDFLSLGAINTLYLDRKKNIWIGTRRGIVIIKNDDSILKIQKGKNAENGLSDSDILSFQEDHNGYMWVGTRNGGLNLIDTDELINNQSLKIQWYLPSDDYESINNRTVSVLFLDKQENMWIGTPTGISFTKTTGEIVGIRKHINGIDRSLSHNRIGAIASAKNGNIWIGTDGGGLDYYDIEQNNYKHYSKKNNTNSLSSDYILSLLEDSKGRLWIGTYREGLNCYYNGKFEHYLQGAPSEGSDVRVIFEDRKKQIWVGTNRGGLFKYDEKNKIFNRIEVLEKLDIRDIAQDQNDNLWLATYGSGLKKYNVKEKSVTTYSKDEGYPFPSNIVFSVLYIGNNEIYAGTRYEGLVHLNTLTNEFQRISEIDGLSNNSIVGMTKENDNYIWLSTFKGINRYDTKNKEVVNISSLTNLQNGEFNIGAITKSTDGTIYIGGNNGLNFFDPSKILQEDSKVSVYFENLRILNQKVNVQKAKGAILYKSLLFENEICLDYNENSFSIDFHSMSFPFVKNTELIYKLKGYNDVWLSASGSGTANFTKVPPGNYQLMVKSKSGINAVRNAQLGIIISPPFWSTWPAYILYLFTLILIIFLISKYYSERLKLRNSIAFEKKRYQLEHKLNEERLRFFTGFSHELKTPLTLILAPIENLLQKINQKDSREDLKFIKRNAKNLQQAINKLLEFRKSEEGLSELHYGTYNIENELNRWLINFQPLANEKKVHLKLSYTINECYLYCDIEKIAIIINNLLSNAVKYSVSNSEVELKVFYEDEKVKIRVANQGEGISSQEINHIFEWYYRAGGQRKKLGTGIGLALSKSFAELHEGTINVTSVPDQNTKFTLCIPKKFIVENTEVLEETSNYIRDIQIEDFDEVLETRQEKSINTVLYRNIMLIIDDNPEIRLFLENLFKKEYDLLFSENGNDGLKKAMKYIPDIIISDVMMPLKNGIDLCQELKDNIETSHIPVILLTAKQNTESISSGYKGGADLYVTKPFKPKLLNAQVSSLLANRKKLRSLFTNYKNQKTQKDDRNSSNLIHSEKQFLQSIENIVLNAENIKNINTTFLAKELGMSRTPLYRKVKALTGLNINELIRDIKLKKAADLIYREEYSVTDASFTVGFNSLKYFRKIFKEKYGSNPSEYKP
ncbi:Signal transduction histidine kinase [Zunongwangia mangrovi]|uniref:histidine kinase n=1 Tax=Zunongwangia mangrovi TaxID=1334022 RepID=A0A1I1HD17_9FLAO|nr:two-component regulator propeller domain-containing protein [Zunongwangia mangrovi]SFC21844.1 Signal transduction histidine kinase [Zunongwangia mangrovi]